MKKLIVTLLGSLFMVSAVRAQQGAVFTLIQRAPTTANHSDKDTKEDIARHRAIAAAHEAAAKCREAGTAEDVCIKALTAACKGLAIGKYCGMKHEH